MINSWGAGRSSPCLSATLGLGVCLSPGTGLISLAVWLKRQLDGRDRFPDGVLVETDFEPFSSAVQNNF